MRPPRGLCVVAAAGLGTALGACHPDAKRFRLDPIPLSDAARIVNENNARIGGTLRAQGAVDGRFTLPDGRNVGYHLDGILFLLAPTHVRFDLKRFGDRQFLFGSNAEHYWYYDKEQDKYECARHGEVDLLPPIIPVRPDQMADALALTPIPTHGSSDVRTHLVQRVTDDYQQVLILQYDEYGDVVLEKEYWLDRYAPRMVRRVIFRDADGVVTLESHLDDYAACGSGGLLLPRTVTAYWADPAGELRFRISRWLVLEGIGPDAIQFTAPPECE